MKLVRYGPAGKEKPGLIDADGKLHDLSRKVKDIGPDALAPAKLKELDGTVDAIGLGGIDVYLYAGTDRYALRDGLRLLDAVKITPVVDGSGLKNTLERNAISFMQTNLGIETTGLGLVVGR